MPRRDPRYNALDVIRILERNLDFTNKQLVIAWFFTAVPIKEPKVDVLQFVLDLLALIPVAGAGAKLFEIGLETAQVIKDLAELFGLEFEEEDVELARLKFELESLEKEFREQRQELLATQIELDQEKEQSDALRATIELVEDENRRLAAQVQALPQRIRAQTRIRATRILQFVERINTQVPLLPPGGPRGIIRGMAARIRDEANDILGGL